MIKNHIEQLKQMMKEEYGIEVNIRLDVFTDQETAEKVTKDMSEQLNLPHVHQKGDTASWYIANELLDGVSIVAFYPEEKDSTNK